MTRKLTASNVHTIKPPETGQLDVYDKTLPGFMLRVSASGTRSFAVMYRPKAGPRKGKLTRLTLGRLTDQFGLGEARQKARDIMHAVEHTDADPAHDNHSAPETFKAVAESFLKRHVEKRGLRTQGEIERQLERYVYPEWGDRPIAEIRRPDVAALLDEIEDNSGPTMADRVLATIRKLFNWHMTRDDEFVSPVVKGMARTRPAERKRDRVLSDDEIRAIWPHLSGPFGALVKTLLYTGQRLGKVSAMRWQDIEDGTWTLPTEPREKNNPGSLKLPQAALDIIAAQPRIVGSPYVFAGRGGKQMVGFSPLKRKLDKVVNEASDTDVPHWTLHDLRRSARSLMARAGVRPDHAERTLGHVIAGVQGTYDRYSYQPERAAALDKLAREIDRILDPQHAKVVPLRTPA